MGMIAVGRSILAMSHGFGSCLPCLGSDNSAADKSKMQKTDQMPIHGSEPLLDIACCCPVSDLLLNSLINDIKRFPAHVELGTCRTSFVSPKQSVPGIFVWSSDAAFMAVT